MAHMELANDECIPLNVGCTRFHGLREGPWSGPYNP